MLKLAWRNLWRNTRRTLITLSAVSLGTAGIVGITSYRESAYGGMMRSITEQLVGHLQVHGKGYQESPEISNVVPDPVAVEAVLEKQLPGVRAERRVLGAGLGGSADSSSGVLITGLEPGATNMLALKEGHLLSDAPKKEAVIGTELANQLGIKLGGELVLVGQAADGSLANDRFTVVGLVDAGTTELNSTSVFLHLKDAQDFFGLGDGVHQIVLRLPTEKEDVSGPLGAARAALDLKTLEALSWNQLLPELKGTMDSKRQSQKSVDFVMFFIVALGVLNAMTMSTFERTREFGVMLAVGTRPGRIVRLVVTEALLQGLLGLVAGVVLVGGLFAAIGTLHFGGLSGTDMAGVRMPEEIHLKLLPEAIRGAATTVIICMVGAGLLPAWRASRLQAADAVREA
jgi:ABC-type lipoprotein release transport system permease subunit